MLNASLAEAEDVRFASSRDDASSSVVGGGAVTASPPRSPLMVEADLLAARVANLRSEIEARAEEADVLAAREASLRVKIMRSVSKECHPQRKQVTASLVEGNAAASTCTDFAKTISSPSPSSKLPKLGWNDSPSGSGLTVHAPAPLKTWPENVERTAKQGSASKTKPSPPSSSPSPSEPTPPPADPSSSQRLVATAEGKKGKKASKLLELSDDDVRIDYKMPPLGGGAFCAVYPIRLLRDDNAQTRRFGDFSGSNDQGRPRQRQSFALKRLRRAVVENTSALRAAAAADLRREAELLADCSHENVVRLHGTRKRRAIASASENDNHDDTDAAAASRLQEEKDKDEDDENFFIVLEKLEETLESRLERWYRKRGRFGKHFTPNETVVSRIRDVALGIARGMEYLHSKNIIFRGLKPANVGFDGSGHVKLFNFGLAQKCDVDPVTGSPYAAGRMGTLRYMAPEVAKAGGRNGSDGGSGVHYYSLSADVFSFALLLWQIVTSRVPYEHEIPTTSTMIATPKPIPDHKRPSVKYVESWDLRALLKRGWAARPEDRPTFRDVASELERFLAQTTKAEDGADDDIGLDSAHDSGFSISDEYNEALVPPSPAASVSPPSSPECDTGGSLLASPFPIDDEVAGKPSQRKGGVPSQVTMPPSFPSLRNPESGDESSRSVVPEKRKGEGRVLELSDDDVQINYKALGSGAFCSVYPVHLRREKGSNGGEFDLDQRLALKRLRLAVVEDASALHDAVEDLAREADILADLNHENIIRLHGMTRCDDRDERLRDGTFFIVLDALADTLDSRLEKWSKKRKSRLQRCTPREAVVGRIQNVALGIAMGMEYLHSNHIIFRDLKPSNIGFDDSGRVKIFDFGLAQKCDVDPVSGSCRATGKVGTLRYMAPEVAEGNGVVYGLPADVFSFALLLWQIVTSRVPYEHEIPTTSAMVTSPSPIPKHKRPSLKYVESEALRNLLESSWAFNPEVRPIFGSIGSKLRDFIA